MPPPTDPRWPKLLSLSVHEFRTPITVVAGYLRMLLKDRAGPITDQQRRLLEEADKSCARLSMLLTELSDLANLEAGSAPFNRQTADLRTILKGAVAQLPELPDRTVNIDLQTEEGMAPVNADATRLGSALASVIAASRREIVTTDRLFVRESRRGATHNILIGDEQAIADLERSPDVLPVFDEWRGGCGLSLAVARRVFEAHGGHVWSARDGQKSGAKIELPAA